MNLHQQDEATDDNIPDFLQRRNAVKCMRCLVEVPVEQIGAPERCTDKRCPLKGTGKGVTL